MITDEKLGKIQRYQFNDDYVFITVILELFVYLCCLIEIVGKEMIRDTSIRKCRRNAIQWMPVIRTPNIRTIF